MTTYLTDNQKNNVSVKSFELKEVSKQYPFLGKTPDGLSRNYHEFWALKDVSFEVYKGEVLGIIGRNGAGKTTLLNIIAGVLSPTEGQISVKTKVLGLFNLGVGFQEELTGRENIFLNGAILGAKRKELEDKLGAIIAFSELGNFIDMPLGSYSQGMRLRLGFSIVVNLDTDILVLDEVLAVGDVLFQNKCFERLMDFKRAGKTLIITTQGLDLIQRLCDRAILLDHGKIIFSGNTTECVNHYRAVLDADKFFVGPPPRETKLIENTKKWADDVSYWGKEFGTKEAVIAKVELLNKFGWGCARIKSGERLKIKVYFKVRERVKDPHFGIAIFREDGVYCHGPNTVFDGFQIPELKQGEGFFSLDYRRFLLAPGEYRISVAIWDKDEVLSYNYHDAYYKLTVDSDKESEGSLINIPVEHRDVDGNFGRKGIYHPLALGILKDKWGTKAEDPSIIVESVQLLDYLEARKEVFITNEKLRLIVTFSGDAHAGEDTFLWVGIYRDDGVYCQGLLERFCDKIFNFIFPKLPLLPGGYRISVGVWNARLQKFIMFHHGTYPFRMVFDREDHGTIYLEHAWEWRLPKN
ncbi:MAG: Wzt carbohydrate-binding domain-containing protein [Candidatus Omnitrophica bacterium]|nr:Wzt carbohydrate-binding domain-containing protein [Candidatus Omnitrophota bacterium]